MNLNLYKTISTLLVATVFQIAVHAQAPISVWNKAANSSQANATVVDDSGYVYVTGSINNTTLYPDTPAVTFAGSGSSLIVKYSRTGELIWAKSVGGAIRRMDLDAAGNLYCIGRFTTTVDLNPDAAVDTAHGTGRPNTYILKLTKDGIYVWGKSFGLRSPISATYGYSISVDKNNNVYVIGTANKNDSIDFNPGPAEFIAKAGGFVCKLDEDGNFDWVRTTVDYFDLYDLDTDDAGNVYYSGAYYDSVDMNWGAGTYMMYISNGASAGSSGNAFVSKLDSLGNFQWASSNSSTYYSEFYALTADRLGNTYATGYYQDSVYFVVGTDTLLFSSPDESTTFFSIVKCDPNGHFVWAKSIGDSKTVEASDIIQDDRFGGVYLSGYFADTTDFDPGAGVFTMTLPPLTYNGFIEKLDPSGNFLWARQIGEERTAGGQLGINSQGVLAAAFSINTSTFIMDGDTITNLISSSYNMVLSVFDQQFPAFCDYTSTLDTTICQGQVVVIGNHSYSTAGTYTDTLVNTFNCDTILITTVTVTTCSSIPQDDGITLQLYPNPSENSFTILGLNLNGGTALLELTDVNGRVVKSENMTTNQIDISTLGNGIYFGRLRAGTAAQYQFKVVKQ